MYIHHLDTYKRAAQIPGFYTAGDLQEHGWFDSTIEHLMPNANFYDRNPINPIWEPIAYYSHDRVHELFQSTQYYEHQNGILDKAAQNQRHFGIGHQPFIDEVLARHTININCPNLQATLFDLKSLCTLRIFTFFPSQDPDRIDEALLANVKVNLLMEALEPQLWQCEGYFFHPQYSNIIAALTAQCLTAIGKLCSELQKACHECALRNFIKLQPFSAEDKGLEWVWHMA